MKVKKFLGKVVLILLLVTLFSGCVQQNPGENITSPAQSPVQKLRLSTTTSTCDTGILDVLNAKFEQKYNANVSTLCQGTGKAIATGELGAADVVMVHAPPAEKEAVARGSFIDRKYMMYNYFVIIGPKNDPADVRNSSDAMDAFRRIAKTKSLFMSRGDDSGTNKKEKIIWKSTNITPSGSWYQLTGQGMGNTMITADVKQAYTLSDIGTYLAMRKKVNLVILKKDNKHLFNPYHVMAVNPKKFPNVNYKLATEYINFVESPEIQKVIGNYGLKKYGVALFVPTASTPDSAS